MRPSVVPPPSVVLGRMPAEVEGEPRFIPIVGGLKPAEVIPVAAKVNVLLEIKVNKKEKTYHIRKALQRHRAKEEGWINRQTFNSLVSRKLGALLRLARLTYSHHAAESRFNKLFVRSIQLKPLVPHTKRGGCGETPNNT